MSSLFKKSNVALWMALVTVLGCVLVASGYFLGGQAEAKEETKVDSAKKKILFIAGPPSHANGEHEFRAGCMLLADALNKSTAKVEAKVHWYGWPKDISAFDGVDAVIVYADAGGKMNKKIQELMDTKVKQGMGIMFMHYGVHPTKEVGEKYFGPWTGAYFETGWSVNPHWIADMTAKQDHPVGNGLPNKITAYDEFYFNMRKLHPKGDCECCIDLAVATPEPEKIVRYINLWNEHGDACFGTPQGLMWAREPGDGQGRGVGFVGGHYHRNWAIDDFRKLTLNAIAWVAGAEVPKNGVESEKITEEKLNENLDRPVKDKPIKLPTDALLKQKPMPRPKDPANYRRR